jgi:hypothetical protein
LKRAAVISTLFRVPERLKKRCDSRIVFPGDLIVFFRKYPYDLKKN